MNTLCDESPATLCRQDHYPCLSLPRTQVQGQELSKIHLEPGFIWRQVFLDERLIRGLPLGAGRIGLGLRAVYGGRGP